MEKKKRIDGISLAIAILNLAIVAVLITLVVLIYLYMTGKLENADVANMEQSGKETAALVTTAVTTETVERETEPAEETSETVTEPEESEPEETTEPEVVEAVEEDVYDADFFENDLFIGDSIYTGLVNYGYFDSDHVFAEIGLNPESVFTKTNAAGNTALSMAEAMQPKRIFIMLGSNGLAFLGNTHMAEEMGLLVDKLREVCPDSYVYVVSIPPVTKAHDAEGQETMVMVNGYNKLLKNMAEEKGVVYLDLCAKLENASGYFSEDYAEADGLHFLGSAYKRMLSFFQRSIQL